MKGFLAKTMILTMLATVLGCAAPAVMAVKKATRSSDTTQSEQKEETKKKQQ